MSLPKPLRTGSAEAQAALRRYPMNIDRDELIAECQKALELAARTDIDSMSDEADHARTHSPRASRVVLELVEELSELRRAFNIIADEQATEGSRFEIMKAERDALRARLKLAKDALREIEKGDGAFSVDHLTHAANCIDKAVQTATAALATLRT